MSEFDDIEYQRDSPREAICSKAEIMIGERWHDCVIANISPSGARLYVDQKPSRGMAVFIKLSELGQFSATVAWCRGDEVGVKFDHDPSEMTRVLIQLESQD
jgi:hypothetical protein